MTYTTQKQVRAAFWELYPELDLQARLAGTRSKGQNAQCATVRCAFVCFVDHLYRTDRINDALAERVTL